MSRIVSLGIAAQEIFLTDRDDFAVKSLDGESVFSELQIGTTIEIDHIWSGVGGGGANAAVTFARHGHETIFIGNLAHDSAGEAVTACFDTENIDSSYVEYTEGNSACFVYLLDARTSQRTALKYRGVSAQPHQLDPNDLAQIQPDWLYISALGGDLALIEQFCTKAHQLGVKVMFAPDKLELTNSAAILKLLPAVDAVIMNREEASQLVGGSLLTELIARLKNYANITIITDGVMGAIASNQQETYRLGVYEQHNPLDLTGVGDAFGSGFLAHFARHANFKQALHFAAANATAVTMQYGAETGILEHTTKLHTMPITLLNNEGETNTGATNAEESNTRESTARETNTGATNAR